MLKKVKSLAFFGLDALEVDVEVNISNRGLPSFDIVGLPNKSIEESKHRIKSAIQNSGEEFPNKKITVNLAPADIHKEGSFYDMAIAVGILSASCNIDLFPTSLFFGELSLDGSIRTTKGSFSTGLFAMTHQFKELFVPFDNVSELGICSNLTVYGVPTLRSLLKHLQRTKYLTPSSAAYFINKEENLEAPQPSIDDIVGQEKAKKMAAVMLAGGHHMLLVGPPGIGKTLLATSLKSIMPPLSLRDSIEVTKIYSCLGKLNKDAPIIRYPPIRAPHHSTSYVGMIGGGANPRPGEITLSHLGVLFLDELCEFPRQVLEVLRQPLEEGFVSISRSRFTYKFPAKFTLFAATNPCKCGYKGDPNIPCKCSPSDLKAYTKKLSGPFIDRIDLVTTMTRPPDFIKGIKSQINCSVDVSAATLKEQVIKARDIQKARYNDDSILNRDLGLGEVKQYCVLSESSSNILTKACQTFNLSARATIKVLKVARTLADMSGESTIRDSHLIESLQYKYEGTL